jgi:hypothetical protein
MCCHFGTLRSFFTGGVSRKNSWDEIGRVFMQVGVLFEIASANQNEGGWRGDILLDCHP